MRQNITKISRLIFFDEQSLPNYQTTGFYRFCGRMQKGPATAE